MALHMTKNEEVLLHKDKVDAQIGIIYWGQKGSPSGGEFIIPGSMYQFHLGSGSCIIFRSTKSFHGTMPFGSFDENNYRLGMAIVNRVAFCSIGQNQLRHDMKRLG